VGLLVKKLILAFLLIATVLSSTSWALRRAKARVLGSPLFVVSPEVRTLMVGDSHIEASLDPDKWPGSANFASSGEGYFFTYYKLRHTLNRNPGIATIVLGCSWHNFSRLYQDSYLTGDKASTMQDYFLLLDQEARAQLYRWDPDYVVPYLTYEMGIPLGLFKNRALQRGLLGLRITPHSLPILGGYEETLDSAVEPGRLQQKLVVYFGEPDTTPTISATMTTYLKRIIGLCRERGIQVILLNTPLHRLFRDSISPGFKREVKQVLTQVAAGPGVVYVDLSELPIPTEYFKDSDHVNRRGAEATRQALCAKLPVELEAAAGIRERPTERPTRDR
jgi:hypothetical protein